MKAKNILARNIETAESKKAVATPQNKINSTRNMELCDICVSPVS